MVDVRVWAEAEEASSSYVFGVMVGVDCFKSPPGADLCKRDVGERVQSGALGFGFISLGRSAAAPGALRVVARFRK